ncbi:MAG: hypothetical protein ACTSX0_11325, partial [Promethearchaeota archaeon]
LTNIAKVGNICITPEIQEEIEYFQITSWNNRKTFVIPVQNEEIYRRVQNDGFDAADASLIANLNTESAIGITEDRPLLKYAVLNHYDILFLVDFLKRLVQLQIMKKNEFYRINKALYQVRNIKKSHFEKNKLFAQRF